MFRPLIMFSQFMSKRVIAVIDLKAFYASVECIDRGLNPFTTPLVVADTERGEHTIVLSVSPFLKNKGIPSRLRLNELPKGINYIYAKPRMERYIKRSKEVIDVFLKFVSYKDIHVYSIDEAFIDLTSYINFYNIEPYKLVKNILEQIKNITGLTATAGIGDNMFLSKVALDVYAKKEKDGIAYIKKEDIESKLWTITPLEKIWGIGSRMQTRLNMLNIYSVKDLATTPKEILTHYFGVMGEQLYYHANGIDEANMQEPYNPIDTSISIGQVLPKDYTYQESRLIVKEMCEDLYLRLLRENKKTKCIHLYLGFAKLGGSTAKQLSLFSPSDDLKCLEENVLYLYDKLNNRKNIRRISISLSSLVETNIEQIELFSSDIEKIRRKQLYKTVMHIKDRYGDNSLIKASALLAYSTSIERHNQIGGHHR